jgi:hypothetical protein
VSDPLSAYDRRATELANVYESVAHDLMGSGEAVFCVWSGERLDQRSLDVDHCFPWVAWPCGDLWNLLPPSRRVN